MSVTHVLITFLGEVSLLLWGIHMVHSGVLRAYGSDLRRLIRIGLRNRLQAVLAGIGVTAVLQSSTATGLMATSFAAEGVVDLVPALAVMLGANIGTTLIVQVLSFDITLVFPLLLFVGLVAFRRGGQTRTRDLGRVAIGLGLMLLSLHLLIETMQPAETAPIMRALLRQISSDPFMTIGIAALLTWLAHSSVAVVLLIMSLAGTGVITPEAAVGMVLGANLGSAINPVLEGAGNDPVKLRLPVGNLINRLVGCTIAAFFVGPTVNVFSSLGMDPAHLAANVHTAFNLIMAALFLPFLPQLAGQLKRFLPDRPRAADPGTPLHLDMSAVAMPSVALANAARETLRMADVVQTMLRGIQTALHTHDRKRVAEISRMDDVLDDLYRAIQRYLTAMRSEAMHEDESRRLSEILAFSINLEHIGDIIDKNLSELVGKSIRMRLRLSAEGLSEIDHMLNRLLDHLQLAIAVFMASDLRSARRLFEEKEQFRDLERVATERHFDRVREGRTESIETSGLHLDLVRDLKRIESHIAAAAYPILEQNGVLRASRLAEAPDAHKPREVTQS